MGKPRKRTGDVTKWLVDADIRAVVIEIVRAYRTAGSAQADVAQLAVLAREAIVAARLFRPTNNKNVTYWISKAHTSAANIEMSVEKNYVHRPKSDIALVLYALSEARRRQQWQEREYAAVYAAYRREPHIKALREKVRLAVHGETEFRR